MGLLDIFRSKEQIEFNRLWDKAMRTFQSEDDNEIRMAIKCFDKLLKMNDKQGIDTGTLQILSYKGVSLMSLAEYKKAIKAFDEGIAVHTFLPDKNSEFNQLLVENCFYNKGICLMNLGKLKQAIEEFELSGSRDAKKMIKACKSAKFVKK